MGRYVDLTLQIHNGHLVSGAPIMLKVSLVLKFHLPYPSRSNKRNRRNILGYYVHLFEYSGVGFTYEDSFCSIIDNVENVIFKLNDTVIACVKCCNFNTYYCTREMTLHGVIPDQFGLWSYDRCVLQYIY